MFLFKLLLTMVDVNGRNDGCVVKLMTESILTHFQLLSGQKGA